MARPTAAAAAGLLACAVLFLLAGQSAAYWCPLPSRHPTVFPLGYVAPPPVRIYSKQNPALNMAARDGKVILVKATLPINDYDYNGLSQLWWKIPLSATLFGYMYGGNAGDKYWLVNVATGDVMTSPPANGPMQVYMEKFNPWNAAAELWVSTSPLNGNFYQIKPYTQGSKALNGLWGNVHEGTEIGIYSDRPVDLNTLWVISSAFPYYY